MDNLSDLLSSLSQEDIESLKSAAASLLGSNNGPSDEDGSHSEKKDFDSSDNGGFDFSSIDPEMIMRINRIMKSMNHDDSRSQLIKALKPHLSEPRKKRADEAIRILKLLDMLPLLREQGII